FAENLGSVSAKLFFNFLYFFLPNLSFYGFVTNASHGDVPPVTFIAGAIVYAAVYIGILLAATVLIFSRRNFK
ncbi:MAG TPA: hypothetical protein VK308_16695, partial [Pyrinomonadaceae bacterium]|nr:hypothetical protein [Pyrinomonadaceae bacterium]